MKSFFNSIKTQIDQSDVISFDIFDTLLVRPYVKPSHLFSHLEKIENVKGFGLSRVKAEQSARLKNKTCEEITIAVIYKELEPQFQHLLRKEEAFEEMVLRANPEIKQVFDYALSQGKRVIIASDMYLSREFLARVLEKEQILGWEKLYVSSEIGFTKESGSLFKYIMEDLNIDNPNSILHIGDNKRSDYLVPKNMGIQAILYQQVVRQFIECSNTIRFKELDSNCLTNSIIISLLAQRWIKQKCGITASDNYWESLGYQYAGPVIYAYAKFIENKAINDGLEHILFVARDGYTIQKVFNTFDTGIPNSYVYAPRFLSTFCLCDFTDKSNINLRKLLDEFSAASPEIYSKRQNTSLLSDEDYKKFIKNNRTLFTKVVQSNLDAYRSNLSQQIADCKSIAIVDSLTIGLSAQKLIEHALNFKVLGLYWCDISNRVDNKFKTFSYTRDSFSAVTDDVAITKNWNFMEFLMTSPEFPIKRFSHNGNPVYHESNEYERKRSEFYTSMSKLAVCFAEDIKSVFNGHDVYFDPQSIIDWVNMFIDYPTDEDFDHMKQVLHAADAAHNEYAPLFCADFTFKEFIKNPKKTLKGLRSCKWHSRKQLMLLCLLKPLKCKLKGLKRIEINLFPKLKRRYCTLSFSITDSIRWTFAIGKF